jgi:hypothetical protein
VEEPSFTLGWCEWRRRIAESEAGGREGGREVHEAEDSPSALVTPRDLRRCGRAAAIELEPWPTELRPPPPDRGRSAANFSRLDAEESAAAILRREAPPRGGVAGLRLCYTSRRCAAPRLKSLLRPPRCSSSPQAAAPPASPHTIAPPASPHASGAGSAEVCARAPTVGAAGAPVEDLVTLQRRWRRAEREGGGRGLTRAVGMGEMREKPGIEC